LVLSPDLTARWFMTLGRMTSANEPGRFVGPGFIVGAKFNRSVNAATVAVSDNLTVREQNHQRTAS